MSRSVPALRGIVHADDIVTGQAVRAQTWLTAAQLLNWCGGKGAVLVPAYCPSANTIKATEVKTYSYRVTPSGRAVMRIWSVALAGAGDVTIKAGSLAPVTVSATASITTHEVREVLAAKSGTVQTLTLVITSAASSSDITIASISCYEAPRPSLDAADAGIDTLTTMARAPIDERVNSSLGGIVDALATMHRRHYVAFARPEEEAWSTTSGAYGPVLTAGCIVARKLYPTSTTGAVRWYAYVKTSAATTGTIRVTHSGGGTATIAIAANTSWTWQTVDATAQYPCEDLSTADGLAGGTWPTYTVEFKRASGAGTVYVASVCAEEV